jgi:hypothetical protein
MTTATTVSAADVGLAALAFARGLTTRFAQDIADSDMTKVVTPSKKSAAWILGHIAATDDYFYRKLSGRPSVLPEGFGTPFGGGSEAVDDPTKYPTKAKLALERTHKALTSWYAGLGDDQLAAAPPKEAEMFGTTVAAVAGSIAWHEGVHTGQLIEVRCALGLPRLLG